MMSHFVSLVVLLGTVNLCLAEHKCKGIPPMANYTSKLVVPEKYYLIALNTYFMPDSLSKLYLLHCDTNFINSAAPLHFDMVVTEQASDGTYSAKALHLTNRSPPGTWHLSNPENGEVTVLGIYINKLRILYWCNTQNGIGGIYVYYYKQVNGLKAIDTESSNYLANILQANHLDGFNSYFKEVNNLNCTNVT